MNISEKTIAEIEQIFNDITTGPQTPLREQLVEFLDISEKNSLDRIDREIAIDPNNVGDIGAIIDECNRSGFVMGFIYARTLLG